MLAAVAEGCTETQVAERLHVARGTVANCITLVLAKLQAPNRTAAVVLALQRRWLCLDTLHVSIRPATKH